MRVPDHCMFVSKLSSGHGSFLDHGGNHNHRVADADADAGEECSDENEDAGKKITWRTRCGLSSSSSSDINIEPPQEQQHIRNRHDHQISPGGKPLFPWEDEAEAPKKTEDEVNSHSHFHFHGRRRRTRKTSKRDHQRFGFRVSTEGAAGHGHGHGSDLGFGDDDDEEEEEEEENYSYNRGGGLMAAMREQATGSGRSRLYSMDMEEVKACRDLGFESELEPKHHQLRSAASSGSDSPTIIPQYYWSISSPGDDPRDVKARLREWAQAVALASATSRRR